MTQKQAQQVTSFFEFIKGMLEDFEYQIQNEINPEEKEEEITKEAVVIKQLMDENIRLHKANKQIVDNYNVLNKSRAELLNRNNQLVAEINERYSQPNYIELEKENTKLKNKLNLIYNNISKIVNGIE